MCARRCVCVCVCVNPGRWTIGKNTEIFQLIEIFSSVWSNLSWKDLHSSLSFNFFTWFYYSISFHFSLLLILLCPSLPFSFISSRSYILNSIVNVIFFFFFNYFWNSNLVSANESRSYYRVYTSAAYSFWKVEPIYFWKECEREHVQAHETYSSTVWISYILSLSFFHFPLIIVPRKRVYTFEIIPYNSKYVIVLRIERLLFAQVPLCITRLSIY